VVRTPPSGPPGSAEAGRQGAGHEGRKARRRSRGPDKRRKSWSKGITSRERKDLLRADGLASLIGQPLNTTLDFHPSHLATYPTANLNEFFAALRMRISTWLRRKRIGTYWVWARENYAGERRENYAGERREHLHIVLHLPPRYRAKLEAHIRVLPPYKGDAYLVQVGERTSVRCPVTGRWIDGLAYRMKQLRGDAVGAPGPYRLTRETTSRYDGAPVAPVYGQRCGVSDSLSLKAEQQRRIARQEHFASTARTGIGMMAAQEGARAPEPLN
jgi:hypothetical protein